MASYAKVVADFETLIEGDKEDALLSKAKELMESSDVSIKAAACHAVGKYRLQKEMMIFQQSSFGKVFSPLEEALRLYVEAQNKSGEAGVHDSMSQAYLLTQDMEMAMTEAKTAARMYGALSDKKGSAATCKTLYEVYISQGDKQKALMNLKERISILRGLGDKKQLAEGLTLLSALQLEKGMKAEAKSNAEQAAALSEEVGDSAGEKKAKKTLSEALVLSGKVDQAPNRREALKYLTLVASATERQSDTDFKTAMYELQETGGYTAKELDDVLIPIIERNPNAKKFLDEMGAKLSSTEGAQQILEFTKRYFYINFRTGGIQYGPRFQCVRGYRNDNGKFDNCMATLKPSSQAEAWEVNCGYHKGILDGALQSGSVAQGPKY